MSIESPVAGDIAALAARVQRNCDLSDSRYAEGMSLCAYLLDMREYYRWGAGLPLGAPLERAAVGQWIARREADWEALRDEDDADYAGLGDGDDAYAEAEADRMLAPLGLVYGAGIGRFGRPLFVLAERGRIERRDGIEIVIAGRELARGLTAPPAVSRGGRVLIRLDALQRWLWAKYEEWQHHTHAQGFAAAWHLHVADLARRRLPADPVAIVRQMAAHEVEALILHEVGEQRAGNALGADWETMLEALMDRPDGRRAELLVRALRDLLADCATTLPALLARDDAAALHFWFGNLDGMRRELAPDLAAAYRAWCAGDGECLVATVADSAQHWRSACAALLACWREGGEAAVAAAATSPEGYVRAAVQNL